jgi:glyoxylase-like metal-dependent hydrolase (beta-lactamase superfamily II)
MKKLWAVMLTVLSGASVFNIQANAETAEVFTFKVGDAQLISFVTARRDIGDDTFITPELLEKYKKTPGYASSAINYFILKDKGEYTLFDAGLGKNAGNDIVANLAKAGVKPSDIKRICITHMHGDHIGGLMDNGAALFPNADIYIAKEEAEYWKQRDELSRRILAAYSKKLTLFSQNASITPLIASIPAFGHTPGHTMFKVGASDAILIWGDIIHAQVQFTEPKIALRYDVDPAVALVSRNMALSSAGKQRIAGMHLSGSGVGRVEQTENTAGSFRFITDKGE